MIEILGSAALLVSAAVLLVVVIYRIAARRRRSALLREYERMQRTRDLVNVNHLNTPPRNAAYRSDR